MKIIYLNNNPIGDPLLEWLESTNEVVRLESKITAKDIIEIKPDFVVSYSYRHIISSDTLDALPGKFVNLHVSYLPFNRGADPNAWSFLDDTPKGVTIHVMDSGLDTGPIIGQRKLEFGDDQTLAETYDILHVEIQRLFKEIWPDFCAGKITPRTQVGTGTSHYAREFAGIKEQLFLDDGWNVTIGDLKSRYRQLKGTQ